MCKKAMKCEKCGKTIKKVAYSNGQTLCQKCYQKTKKFKGNIETFYTKWIEEKS